MARNGWPKTRIFLRVITIVNAPEGVFLAVRISSGVAMSEEVRVPVSLFPKDLFDLLSVSPRPRDCRITLTAWAKLSDGVLDPLDMVGPWGMTKGPDVGGWTNQDRHENYEWDAEGNPQSYGTTAHGATMSFG